MLKNKRIACLVFLAALFVSSGGLLVGESYADDLFVPEGWDSEFYACALEGFLDVKEETESIPDTGLTDEQLARIEEITCIEKGVKSTFGLEKMTGLVILRLGKNLLTSLDISKNTALMYLEASNNKLTEIVGYEDKGLSALELNNNELHSLKLDNMSSLRGLAVAHNQLTDLDVSKNTALEALYANHNKLTFIDVSQNSNLQVFYVDDIYVRTAGDYIVVHNAVQFDFSSLAFLGSNNLVGEINKIDDIENVMEYDEFAKTLMVTDLEATNGYAQTVTTSSNPTMYPAAYRILLLAYMASFDYDDGSGLIGREICGLESVDAETCEVILPDGPSREGYDFAGWSDGTNTMQPGEKVSLSEDVVLTAVWHKEEEGDGDSSEEDDVAVPDTGSNTNGDKSSTLFATLIVPMAVLIMGISLYACSVKKSHRKFE